MPRSSGTHSWCPGEPTHPTGDSVPHGGSDGVQNARERTARGKKRAGVRVRSCVRSEVSAKQRDEPGTQGRGFSARQRVEEALRGAVQRQAAREG